MGKKAQKAGKGNNNNQVELNIDPKQLGSGLLIIGITLGCCIGFYFWDPAGWFAATPDPTPVDTTPTTFSFKLLDYYTLEEVEEDDSEIYIYGKDVSKLTADQRDELTTSDFAEKATKESGDGFTPDSTYLDDTTESDYWYYAKATGADYVDRYFIPKFGLNTIYVMNETEDVAMAMVSQDELSTTFVNSTYDEWLIMYSCLDAAEGTGSPAIGEGFLPFGDFTEENDFVTGPEINNFVVLKIGLNITADASYCALDLPSGVTSSKSASGVYIYFEIEDAILGSGEFMIDFNSAIGSTYDLRNCSIGYGSADSFTAWDVYTL